MPPGEVPALVLQILAALSFPSKVRRDEIVQLMGVDTGHKCGPYRVPANLGISRFVTHAIAMVCIETAEGTVTYQRWGGTRNPTFIRVLTPRR
jgi:hypothetical protein